MKKTFFFVFAFVAMVATMLVSCEPEETLPDPDVTDTIPGVIDTIPGGKDDTIDTIEINDTLNISYYGDNYGNQTENFSLDFIEGDIKFDAEGNMTGNGEIVTIELLSVAAENMFPTIGNYNVDTTFLAGTVIPGEIFDLSEIFGGDPGILLMPIGSYVDVVVADSVKESKLIVGGNLEISGTIDNTVLVLNAKFEDGTDKTYNFEGVSNVVDSSTPEGGTGEGDGYNHDYEPTTATNIEIVAESAFLELMEDQGTGNDFYVLSLSSTDYEAYLGIFVPTGTSKFEHTYNVTDAFEDWTVVASPGGDEFQDYLSYVATDLYEDNGDMYYDSAYYVVGGSLSISTENIEANLTTFNGSTIKIKYTGSPILIEAQQAVQVRAPRHNNMTKICTNKRVINKRLFRLAK